MNPLLFKIEVRRNFKGLLIWSLIIAALIFFTMSFFPTFLQYQKQIVGMIQVVPAVAFKMRGFSSIGDIFSVTGFYNANNIIYMMLLGSIFSIVLSSNIILKEEYGKTTEYLMSRPLTRREIFFTKMLVALLNIVLLNILSALVGFIAIQVFKEGEFHIGPFLIISLYTLLLNLTFASIGAFISVAVRRARPVTSFCVGLTMVFYFYYSISKMSGINGSFGYLSPFKWVNIDVLSPGYALEFWRIMLFIGVSASLTILSGMRFRKKDILT